MSRSDLPPPAPPGLSPADTAPYAQPTEDPRLGAQQPLTADERAGEANSVAMGGGLMAGAAAGAAVGAAVGGPVGVFVGTAVGAIAGALGGYAAVSAGDPDYDYWREQHPAQSDRVPGYSYENDYAPAYQLGYQGRRRYGDRAWEQAEAELERDWQALKGESRLSWEQARSAGRAAWERADQVPPR